MARYDAQKSFYNSTRWRKFRATILAERDPVCAECGKIITNPLDCELDHIKELTPENVNDPNISLNPDNVQILCHTCHDKKHNRFGQKAEQGVFLVYGPPLAGKNTYVMEHMQRGDLIVDMDKLFSAISLLPEYDKPNELLKNVFGIRDLLIDNIKTRYGKWRSAWIIGTYPDKYQREKIADDTGATIIYCEATQEECMQRLYTDAGRQSRRKEWAEYIGRWFERYVA